MNNMDNDLTDDEIFNLILVTIYQIQDNSPYPENGVELTFLANNLNMELGVLKEYIQKLKFQKFVSWHFEEAKGGQFFINPTEKALENFEKLNELTLSETAEIILEKSYDFYKRGGYDQSMQLNSTMIGGVVGFNNIAKVQSAIELLENEGYIKNPAVMLDNTIYFIAAKGINIVESMLKKQTANDPVLAKKEETMISVEEISESINNIFIVHGRNEGVEAEVSNFLRRLNLEPIILHEQVNKGKTVIEKFEKFSNVKAAVILFTADDIGKYKDDKEYECRARQNVIFEAGYFIGKLGRENTIILYENGLNIPSDLAGYIYIPLDPNKRWHLDLARELKAIGFDIDLNNL
jgi:predicted nucleotide-binding protein